MIRYSVIKEKFPREFVLLQGKGCKWGKCTFCDYHSDTSEKPFEVNRPVLEQVSGLYGVLDVINSGSCMELDGQTLELLQSIVAEKNIHTLWFEAHWIYRHKLAAFATLFPGVQVKFRCGVETFDPVLRKRWNKGIPETVAAADIAGYFKGICLLCGTDVEDFNHIVTDIETACENFEYLSVNLFCNNTTGVKRNEEIARRFVDEIYPLYKENPKIEILIENNDLGVGSK
ncbi:MAG: radical SAM protein [Bacteroidales bacterium]|nr:radical SAM protein [Bacteroidales bacterium]